MGTAKVNNILLPSNENHKTGSERSSKQVEGVEREGVDGRFASLFPERV